MNDPVAMKFAEPEMAVPVPRRNVGDETNLLPPAVLME